MLPYYYPTTVLVVDDDPTFLASLRFSLEEFVGCELAVKPEAALALVEQRRAAAPSHAPAGQARDPEVYRPHSLVDAITHRLADPARFAEISLIVVDYEMPRMNGVQFCRAIADFPAKKLLLTGKASTETAIAAFNEGAIDSFVKKEEPDLVQLLERKVRSLQHAYFEEMTNITVHLTSVGDFEFLKDAGVSSAIDHFKRTLGIVEHYLVAEPPGVLLVDARGVVTLLIVCHEAWLRSHYEIAQAQDAERAALEMLASGGVVPWFPTRSGFYEPRFADSWRDFMYPAHRCDDTRWRIALVPGERAQNALPAGAVTHAGRLKSGLLQQVH